MHSSEHATEEREEQGGNIWMESVEAAGRGTATPSTKNLPSTTRAPTSTLLPSPGKQQRPAAAAGASGGCCRRSSYEREGG